MTTADRQTAVCAFNTREDAERAIGELRAAGFQDDEIGFAMRKPDGEMEQGEGSTSGGEGLAGGAMAGAGVGGVLGALASGMIPGVGPVIAAGILGNALAGAAAGGASGGLMGWLSGLNIPDEDRRFYETELGAGRAVVTVKARGRYDEATGILSRYGTCSGAGLMGGMGTSAAAEAEPGRTP
jgi:hypothetical protein